MIIECGYCGAPLDVKRRERVTKCRYCGTSSHVQQARTVSVETPAQWKPPKQWVPPPQFAADSAKTLVYHAGRGIRLVFTTISVLLLVGGIAIAVMLTSVSSRTFRFFSGPVVTERKVVTQRGATTVLEQSDLEGLPPNVRGQIDDALKQLESLKRGAIPGTGPTPGLNLLTSAGAIQVLAAYKQAVGVSSLAATRLTLHDQHSSLQVQSPKNPEHVDDYDYRSGNVVGPEPVRLSSSMKRNLKAHLFDPEKVALDRLDELKTAALGKLAYEQATITHVIVERSRGKVEVRIYGRSPRDSGYVRFDDKGKVVRVYR